MRVWYTCVWVGACTLYIAPDEVMDAPSIFQIHHAAGALVATAIHDGHAIREDLLPFVALSAADRLREEDPFTGAWTAVAPTRVVVTRSRFGVDLNRPRDRATYRVPEDCWGLQLYREQPPHETFERSLAEYDDFYASMHRLLTDIVREHGRFVVFDLHSYCHRREGPLHADLEGVLSPLASLVLDSGGLEVSRLIEFDQSGLDLDGDNPIDLDGQPGDDAIVKCDEQYTDMDWQTLFTGGHVGEWFDASVEVNNGAIFAPVWLQFSPRDESWGCNDAALVADVTNPFIDAYTMAGLEMNSVNRVAGNDSEDFACDRYTTSMTDGNHTCDGAYDKAISSAKHGVLSNTSAMTWILGHATP